MLLYTNIYREISKQRLGRKYKALQGIVFEHFVFLCLFPSQKIMESILGNAFSSILEGHNFKFCSPLSVDHGGASGVTKYATNDMPKKSLVRHWHITQEMLITFPVSIQNTTFQELFFSINFN